MQSYRVFWVIDVDAENEQDAAEQVSAILNDKTSVAGVFDVYELEFSCGNPILGAGTRIDISGESESEEVTLKDTTH